MFPLKDLTIEELFKELKENLPIKFKCYELVENVHNKYPLLSKKEISMIIIAIFEVLREELIKKETIAIDKFTGKLTLNVKPTPGRIGFKRYVGAWLSCSTPPKIKKAKIDL